MKLNNDEALSCVGGAKISLGIVALVSALGAFVLGVIDGLKGTSTCASR